MFDERFWLALAFFSFVGLVVRYASPLIAKQLDSKTKQIAEELLAAKEMKEMAAKILAESEQRYKESFAFADKLIKDSTIEAQQYLDEALKAAESEIAKKMIAVENRIKHEKEQAVREIKVKIIDEAMQKVQANLQNIQKNQSDNLIAKAVGDVDKLFS